MDKNEAVGDTHVKDLNHHTLQPREALARLCRAKPMGKNPYTWSPTIFVYFCPKRIILLPQ